MFDGLGLMQDMLELILLEKGQLHMWHQTPLHALDCLHF